MIVSFTGERWKTVSIRNSLLSKAQIEIDIIQQTITIFFYNAPIDIPPPTTRQIFVQNFLTRFSTKLSACFHREIFYQKFKTFFPRTHERSRALESRVESLVAPPLRITSLCKSFIEIDTREKLPIILSNCPRKL